MFRLFRTVGCLSAAVCIVTPVMAQRHPTTPEFQEVKILNDKDSSGITEINVYETFVENAPKAYNIPGAPRFAIVGKDRKFYLGIGGTVKATVSYDWGNPIDNPFDFTTSAIPMSQRPGDGGKVQFSAATSSLYINFVALPGDDNQIGAYFNANLTGNNYYAFDLQYAYIKYRGITAGYSYSLFSDMAAAPPSIDNEGRTLAASLPYLTGWWTMSTLPPPPTAMCVTMRLTMPPVTLRGESNTDMPSMRWPT